jgi:hypothetical protein
LWRRASIFSCRPIYIGVFSAAVSVILQTKTISVGNQRVTLFSVDGGKTWVSKAHDWLEYKRRRAALKRGVRYSVNLTELSLRFGNPVTDFWR